MRSIAIVTVAATLALALPGAPLRAQAPYMSFTGTGYFGHWSLGRSVGGLGDIDADGIDDFALGANVSGSGGHLRVHSGSTGELITTWIALDDWVLTGRSIQRMGDANGDGVGDIVYGSPDQHPDGAQVDIITIRSGIDGSLLMEDFTFSFGPMIQPQVSGAGDIDGDGHEDAIMGDLLEYGEVRVYSGATGSTLLHLDGLFGSSVSELGDVNDDGTPDLLIGGQVSSADDSGVVRIHSGSDGAVLFTLGPKPPADAFGTSMELISDLDLDGLPDVAIGAPQTGIPTGAGYVQFMTTSTGAVILTVSGSPGDKLGVSMAKAGDVNGDGLGDLIVGAPQSPAAGPGKALVLSGRDGSVLRCWAGDKIGDRFGEAVAGAGDLDSDGFADVLVGSPGAGAAVTTTGHLGMAHVFTGCPGVMAPFGDPWTGSATYAPMLVMGGCPVPGGVVELQVKRATPGAKALIFAGVPLPVPSILLSGAPVYVGSPFLLVATLTVVGDAPGDGIASAAWQVPTGLLGTVGLQAFVLGPAPTGGYTATNGLTVTIAPH